MDITPVLAGVISDIWISKGLDQRPDGVPTVLVILSTYSLSIGPVIFKQSSSVHIYLEKRNK